ncbi:MAG: hypothetical protein KA138_12990 [Saprospiraceae bacterium]|nr:hypothetical protein [Saprospiraceae bacterium]
MEFDVLKDLAQTITRNKIKQIEVLGNPGQENSRVFDLYEGISKGQFHSDEEAARYFTGANAKDPNYRKLRNRLIRQLINTSFFVDTQQSMYNERGKALFSCYRDYAAAYILWSKDATKASHYLLQQLLEQTIKFEFTGLTADICRILRQQAALSSGDFASHEKYSKLHRMYEDKRYWEAKAYDYSENLIHHYITRRSPNKEVNILASQYFEELFPIIETVDTIQFLVHTYQIGVIKHLSVNDCKSAIEMCDHALSNLNDSPNINRGSLTTFASQKLACLTQLRIFDEGHKTSEFCLSLTDEGTYNWFRILETQFYYFTYLQQYQEALAIFEKATTHERYGQLSGSNRDIWVMLGGYLNLLAMLGKLNPAEVEHVAGYFSPSTTRFINDFEVLDKEKEGMNIPLVLLPVLYSIAKGLYDEDAFRRSIEALDKYRQRHLENETNRRSAIFLKLLLAVAKKEFEGTRAELKIQKEMQLLKQEPPQLSRQSFAVEVIPYEDLLEMLLQPLQKTTPTP